MSILEPFALEQFACRNRDEAAALHESDAHAARAALEILIASLHQRESRFALPGICRVDRTAVDFLVDRKWGARQREDGLWLPNWRERLECPTCGLNNRQRAVAALVVDHLARRPPVRGIPSVYLMEQVTPIFQVLSSRLPPGSCVGSEYLGDGHVGGDVVNGIRHEDAEVLSFADASLDLVVSNDVLEHVPDPTAALREAARVLHPDGVMLFTIPFHTDRLQTSRRAEVVKGRIVHRAQPEYHGNPVSSEGSLVYTDFGWDLLDEVRQAGFADCAVMLYWSLEYGHLGTNNMVFVARRSMAA